MKKLLITAASLGAAYLLYQKFLAPAPAAAVAQNGGSSDPGNVQLPPVKIPDVAGFVNTALLVDEPIKEVAIKVPQNNYTAFQQGPVIVAPGNYADSLQPFEHPGGLFNVQPGTFLIDA